MSDANMDQPSDIGEALERLDAQMRRRRAQALGATILIVAAAGVLLGVLLYQIRGAVTRLNQLQNQAEGLNKKKEELEADVKRLTEERRQAEQAVAAIERGPQQAPADAIAPVSLPPRVYIHIRSRDQQLPVARTLAEQLRANQFVVPGIERLDTGPGKPVVKFFRPGEQAEAERILAIARTVGIGFQLDPTKGYEGRVRPRHYEIWFGAP